tara:strand:- start:287 stop:640 length:354 start_codon:yes stop_codon:yes gene_type:complete
MTEIQRIQERLEASGEEALGADGYDDCVVGLAYQHTLPLIVYSKRKIIERLMASDDISRADAEEFFDFNIGGAYVGAGTPLFLEDMDDAKGCARVAAVVLKLVERFPVRWLIPTPWS